MQNYNNSQMQTPAPQKSKRRIFIIVGILVFIILFLIVTSIIGVAGYIMWISKKDPEMPFEKKYPANTNVSSNSNSGGFSSNITSNDGSSSNDNLLKVIRNNPKIGRFTLQNVSPTLKNKIFDRSETEVKAIYTANNDKVTVIFAEYKQRAIGVTDFGRMINRAKEQKADIIDPVKFGKENVGVSFSLDKITTLAYCNWPAKEEVLCSLISSPNAGAVTEFNNALKN